MEEFKSQIKEGFILWSWVALLGSYISTTNMTVIRYINHSSNDSGISIDQFNREFLFQSIIPMFPAVIMLIAWVSFVSYSREVYSFVFEISENKDEIELSQSKKSLSRKFNQTLYYMVLTWLFVIITNMFIPVYNLMRILH